MTRAFTLSTLLRRKISSGNAVRQGAEGRERGTERSESAPRRVFSAKPPEPAPAIATRIFDGAPRIRQRC